MEKWEHIPKQHLRKMGERKKLRSLFVERGDSKMALGFMTSAGKSVANVRVNTNGSAPYSNNYYTATHTPKVTSNTRKKVAVEAQKNHPEQKRPAEQTL